MTKANKLLKDAETHLGAYCSLIRPGYKWPKHLITLAKALMAVERGEIKRLIVSVPPRHGKSMLCSQLFPAWFLGRNPEKYIITSTYGQELANDYGMAVRDQLKNEIYSKVFRNSALRTDSQSVSRLKLESGGEYFAVGVGGATTGRGAHLFLIDDPVKNREEADSIAYQKRFLSWYGSVAYTRLMPNGAIVLVMTRWHENDPAGHLLQQKHENWHHICMPALDEDDNALWPQAYSAAYFKKVRETIGEYEFSCLYQQNPLPAEGIIVRPEWIKSGIQAENDYACTFIAVDPAIDEKSTSDETSITILKCDYSNPCNIFEKTVYGNWEFEEQVNMIELIYKTEKPTPQLIGIEVVAYQKALQQVLANRGLPAVPIKADKDKVRRFKSVSDYMSGGRVFINTPKLKEQLLRFRGAANEKNDLVDSFVYALKLIRESSTEAYQKKVPDYVKEIGKSSHDVHMMKYIEERNKLMNGTQNGFEEFDDFEEVGFDY